MEDKTQSLDPIEIHYVNASTMPKTNKNHIRLYGHYLCPFVEKVRLVLHAKGIEYQDCQVNLERRNKWHYQLNGGFVPILELPSGQVILESDIIMNYIDFAYPEKKPLWSSDPAQRARQQMAMKTFDKVQAQMFAVLISHGRLEKAVTDIKEGFASLEKLLQESSSKFFCGEKSYSMVDLYGFPHVSRLFYLQGTPLEQVSEEVLNLRKGFPLVTAWFKAMKSAPELNTGAAIIDERYFKKWVDELLTVPLGTKPPLRLPLPRL